MQRRTVTIADLARDLGLSVATVSHALNNKGRVAPETRERVLAAAAARGYRRNASAHALRTGRRDIVSVHLPRGVADLHFYMSFVFGLSERLGRAGIDLLIASPSRSGAEESGIVDAAVVVDWTDDLESPPELLARGIPVLAVDGAPPGSPEPSAIITVDYRAHIAEAVRRAAANGARRPVLVEPLGHDSAWRDAIVAGFDDGCREAGLEPDRAAFTIGGSAEALIRVLEGVRAELEPDLAVFAGERLAGIALTALGWGRPDSAAPWLVSCAGDIVSELPSRYVTALDLDPAGFGARSAEVLLEVLAGAAAPGARLEWPARWSWAEHWR